MKRYGRLITLLAVVCLVALPLAGCATDDSGEEAQDDPATQDTGSESSGDETEEPEDAETAPFTLTSSVFEDGDMLSAEYARTAVDGGENVSPPVAWSAAPEGVASYALVVVDRHPIANEWIHWMVVDIPGDQDGLVEGASGAQMPAGARELANTWGDPGYGGPQPPAGSGDHEYEFTVYALDVETLDIAGDADFSTFLEAVTDHMIDAATLSGFFAQ